MANTVLLILIGEYCLVNFLIINISLNFDNINCTGEFKKLVDENVFVDKSEFIKEFLEYSENKVVEITRPYGFGKSVNLDMLKTFLEIEVDEYGNTKQKKNNEKYFKNLKISKYKNITAEYQGKYPVIYITFTNVEYSYQIEQSIRKAFLQHRYLLQVKTLKESDKKVLQKYIDNDELNITDYHRSITRLADYLFEHFNKTPVILVDDFDSPLFEDYWSGIFISVGRRRMRKHLKYLSIILHVKNARMLMCGILPIFDDKNRYTIYNYFNAPDSTFSSSFGFTKTEVAMLLKKFHKGNEREIIEQQCGGHYFSKKKNIVYHSRSIMAYLKDEFYEINENKDRAVFTYRKMIWYTKSLILQDYLSLMKNVTLNKEVNNEPIYYFKNNKDIYVSAPTLLFTFGVHFGYFNLDGIKLKIPNRTAQKSLAYVLGIYLGHLAHNNYPNLNFIGYIMFEGLKQKNYKELINVVNPFLTTLYKRIFPDDVDSFLLSKESLFEVSMYAIIVSSKYTNNFQVFARENVEIMRELDIAADHILVPFYGKGSEAYVIKYKIFKSPESSVKLNDNVRNHSSTEYKILSSKYSYIKTICHVTISLYEYKNLRVTNKTVNL